jgi:hypothetical protein
MTRCNSESTSQATKFSRTVTTGFGLEVVILRCGRQRQQRGAGDD